jgi:hypothetical protein
MKRVDNAPIIGGPRRNWFVPNPPPLQRSRVGAAISIALAILSLFVIAAVGGLVSQDMARKSHTRVTESPTELCIDAMDGYHACLPRRP